ncbi:MAG: DUF5684 domain-containing protein [Candidatus Aceula meridiana]|nr:DUF5684 domain-containing protein [Candidatus Aceula meridiana]
MKKILLFLIIALIVTNAHAAKIQLKNGAVITCDIIEKTDQYVEINFRGDNAKFYFNEIESIEEGPINDADLEAQKALIPDQGRELLPASQAPAEPYKAPADFVSILKQLQKTNEGEGKISLQEAIVKFVFGLIFVLLILVSTWKVCNKAGYPGWSQLVPFYGVYVQCKIAGKPGWWLLLFFVPIVSIIVAFAVYIGIARNFGKGVGFGLGLIFLPFIFWPILAFDNSQYMSNESEKAPEAVT